MKQKQFSWLILYGILIPGCAETVSEHATPAATLVSTVQSPARNDSSADATDSLPPQDTYPEKAEVLRLMHQADAKFVAGRFVEALATVEQALQVDPASPIALRLKNRITQILRRS